MRFMHDQILYAIVDLFLYTLYNTENTMKAKKITQKLYINRKIVYMQEYK